MDIAKEFINTYGITILYTVLCAVAGFIGTQIKRIYQKHVNDDTKRTVAKTVVYAVEQIYRDVDGEEKLIKAMDAMTEMLSEKGITISTLEMRMLLESAIAEAKDAFFREEETKETE